MVYDAEETKNMLADLERSRENAVLVSDFRLCYYEVASLTNFRPSRCVNSKVSVPKMLT